MKKILITCFALFLVLTNVQWADASSFTISGPSGFTAVTSETTLINGISVSGDTGTVPVQLRVETGSLEMTTTTGLTFTGSSSGSTLVFSGDVDDVNAALATLTYTRGSAGSEEIEVTLANADDDYYDATGNIYKYIDSNLTWDAARTAAEADAVVTNAGFDPAEVESYLATITSIGENNFATSRLGSNPAWIGASDAGSEGVWRWVTGPEADEDGSGRRFWDGLSSEDMPPGSAYLDRYNSWNGGEPNNSGDEDCAQFLGSNGLWNDLPCNSSTMGSVVEFRRIDGDPLVESDSFTITTISNPEFNDPSGSTIIDELAFDIDVNAAGQSGTFQLIFEEDDEVVNTLTLADLNVANHVFTIDHTDVTSNINVDAATSSTLDEAIYDITLRYTYTDGSTILETSIEDVAFDLEIPTVVSLKPADDSRSATDSFTIVFSEPVQSGSIGLFSIYEADGDNFIYGASFAALEVNGSGTDTLTFDTGAAFEPGDDYYIQFRDGFFIDMRGRPVTGYEESTDNWNFRFLQNASQAMPQPVDTSLIDLTIDSKTMCETGQVAYTARLTGQSIANAIISADPQFISDSWKSFSGSMQHEFVSDEGFITVYALVKNADGGIATLEASDSHELDCPEYIEEAEEQEEEEREDIDLVPVYDEYYGRLQAQDSGEFITYPWSDEPEAISHVEPGWFVRSESFDTVYQVTEDMKRRPFWNAQVFRTHADWDEVVWVTDATLQTLKVASPVLPNPGVSLVKVTSEPEVFYVKSEIEKEVLHKIPSEEYAKQVFGEEWQSFIIDLDPTIFHLFKMGSPLMSETIDSSRLMKAAELR
jgi:hypothetical protein